MAIRANEALTIEAALDEELELLRGPADDAKGDAYERRLLQPQALSALCLSGGGIRSATFNLGLMQGLARLGLLNRFDYLSTVSGGGYIGGWLNAWMRQEAFHAKSCGRSEAAIDAVMHGLAGSDYQGMFAQWQRAKRNERPEPPPISHLRQYSNYLAPRLGVFSADSWTLIATYLRNLLLNWTVLLPMLLAVLLPPLLYAWLLSRGPGGVAPWAIALALIGGLAGVLVALGYVSWDRPTGSRFRGGGTQGRYLWLYLLPLIAGFALIDLSWLWLDTLQDAIVGGHVLSFLLGAAREAKTRLESDSNPFGFVYVLLGIYALLIVFEGLLFLRRRLLGGDTADADWKRKLQMGVGAALALLIAAVPQGLLARALVRIDGFWHFHDNHWMLAAHAVLAVPAVLFIYFLGESVFIGLASRVSSDEDREWWARSHGWLLIAGIAWLALSSLAIFGPELLARVEGLARQLWLAVGGLSGLIAVLVGKSAISPAANGNESSAGWPQRLINKLLLPASAAVFLVTLLALFAALNHWVLAKIIGPSVPASIWESGNHVNSLPHLGGAVLKYAIALLLLWWLASWCININKFSLHGMYRNRLIRAYLGASRSLPGDDPAHDAQLAGLEGKRPDHKSWLRRPHPFTGFDPDDNPDMAPEMPNGATRNDTLAGAQRPLHVVNIAVNLVHGQNLAWQERKACSFTVSPLHSGGRSLGYRRSRDYGGPDGGISLGTAVTISGAAANPNMGYHSSPVVTFLLTLFNVRLGWWLANPRADRERCRLRGPRLAGWVMLQELLGLTDSRYDWLNLSDGGHFDNLGLYEMVLRRCRFVVASDASADPDYEFGDLGRAIRQVRADMGIPIEGVGTNRIGAKSGGDSGLYCRVFRIRYSALHRDLRSATDAADIDGWILYIKPALYGEREPADVINYGAQSDAFPHEPTLDQFFSESQFESYRALGEFIAVSIAGWKSVADRDAPPPRDLGAYIDGAEKLVA